MNRMARRELSCSGDCSGMESIGRCAPLAHRSASSIIRAFNWKRLCSGWVSSRSSRPRVWRTRPSRAAFSSSVQTRVENRPFTSPTSASGIRSKSMCTVRITLAALFSAPGALRIM